MEQEQTQQPQEGGQLSPEEAKASMGIATQLQDQLLAQQNPQPETPQEPQDVPQEQQPDPQEDMLKEIDTLKTQFQEELMQVKKETKDTIKKQIESLRQDIKDALNEEDAKE